MVNSKGQWMSSGQVRIAVLTILGVVLGFFGLIVAVAGKYFHPDVLVLSAIVLWFGYRLMRKDNLI